MNDASYPRLSIQCHALPNYGLNPPPFRAVGASRQAPWGVGRASIVRRLADLPPDTFSRYCLGCK